MSFGSDCWECAICLQNNDCDAHIATLTCNHTFHIGCLEKIIRPDCPLCNSRIMDITISEKIESNQHQYHIERLRTDSFDTISPEVEIMLSMFILRSKGYLYQNMPMEISAIHSRQFYPGELFYTALNTQAFVQPVEPILETSLEEDIFSTNANPVDKISNDISQTHSGKILSIKTSMNMKYKAHHKTFASNILNQVRHFD